MNNNNTKINKYKGHTHKQLSEIIIAKVLKKFKCISFNIKDTILNITDQKIRICCCLILCGFVIINFSTSRNFFWIWKTSNSIEFSFTLNFIYPGTNLNTISCIDNCCSLLNVSQDSFCKLNKKKINSRIVMYKHKCLNMKYRYKHVCKHSVTVVASTKYPLHILHFSLLGDKMIISYYFQFCDFTVECRYLIIDFCLLGCSLFAK
ncbi:hypothetical protein AGLY_005138 [Aphis glycines]|uniref:Uncharacterized protein n=1 Tax=Aphis glycines TaxID=307491 RepID=A0A6G0TX58_APHGL|nr:hypothetical protein AGLY_005138 [Aphis glycines]